MAKTVLSIPEDNVKEVIAVIRSGLYHIKWISQDTRDNLITWCNDEEAYLNESKLT